LVLSFCFLALVTLYLGIMMRGNIISLFLILATPILLSYALYKSVPLFVDLDVEPVDWYVPQETNPDGYKYDYFTTEAQPFNPDIPYFFPKKKP
jgi:hypothetical protein